METIAPKYLLFDHGGVLDGSPTYRIPKPDDLLVFKLDKGLYQVLRDGVQIVKLINILVKKYGYKVGFHSKCKEAEQLRVLQALQEECAKKNLEFPRVSAMAVRDSGPFRGIQPHSPAIIKDHKYGIWIAGYDIEYDGKACLRLALDKLLSIHETDKVHYVIFDDGEKVIECAKREGCTGFLINEKLSLLDALKQVVHKEEELAYKKMRNLNSRPNDLQRSENFIHQRGKTDNNDKMLSEAWACKEINLNSDLQQEIESLVSKKFVLHSLPWKEGIKFDSKFENTNKPRLGGSSLSSGIFIDQRGKEWIGKSDTNDKMLSEAWACKERIAADIYAYYGVNTPKIEMSYQRFANNDCMPDEYSIHTMSELLLGFKTYRQACGEYFKGKQPNPNRQLRCVDGRVLPERGLGHILAVAALINDVDVIGASGGNIGFQEERDQNGKLYANTIKIDPKEAFNPDLSLQVTRSIRFALPQERKGDSSYLPFDSLPLGTQREFLMTLHEIIETKEATFRSFFDRQGAYVYRLYFDRTVVDLTKFLITRQNKLLQEFQQDLKQTRLLFQVWIEKSKMRLNPEDQARKQETNVIQEQLCLNISLDAKEHNQKHKEEELANYNMLDLNIRPSYLQRGIESSVPQDSEFTNTNKPRLDESSLSSGISIDQTGKESIGKSNTNYEKLSEALICKEINLNSSSSNLQEGIESLVPRKFELHFPQWQEGIIRRDSEFKNTNKPRLGGSSLSSGIFIDQRGKEWIGKSDTNDEMLSEAWACKKRIAADIYAYYGINTPKIEMSRQRFANNDCMPDDYGIHTMSELLPGFKTYQQACGEHFRGKQPNPERQLRCVDGRVLPERGLGHILAVASLINDVDVIGASGGNIGFQEERDQNGKLYAKTIKIDPGEAFNPDLSLQVARSIRFALPEEKKGDSQLSFDSLPLGTQKEFLMTLHEIIETTEAILRGFFVRQGPDAFVLYFNTTVEDLTKLLISRQNKLLEEFQQDLKQTKPLFEAWIGKSKKGLSSEDQARKPENNAIQSPDVEEHNQKHKEEEIADHNMLNLNSRPSDLQGGIEPSVPKKLVLHSPPWQEGIVRQNSEFTTTNKPHFSGSSLSNVISNQRGEELIGKSNADYEKLSQALTSKEINLNSRSSELQREIEPSVPKKLVLHSPPWQEGIVRQNSEFTTTNKPHFSGSSLSNVISNQRGEELIGKSNADYEKLSQALTSKEINLNSRSGDLQRGIEPLVPRKFELHFPQWQESIVRRDSEFKNTNKPRLGGSSLSSGIFIDQRGKEWIGKSDTNNTALSEAWACKERIAADIYAYYGVNTPKIEMSYQRFANNDCMQDEYSIHTMSELLLGFRTYQQAYGEDFKGKQPNPERQLRCVDGRVLPERGLGHILAVASLINDVDVIGASGGNIGFQEERDQNGQLYAKTIKIDPGEAFNPDLSLQVTRSIRFALPEEKKGDSQLSFDSLPLGTQQEFLMTLHEIIKSTEATFRGFFARQGAHAFVLYFKKTIEDLTKLLISRQNTLLEEFRQDLEQTKPLFEAWIEKSKMGLSPEDQARKQETNAIQEQLFFYISPDVEEQNQRASLKTITESFLNYEKGSARVLLVKGAAGTGKSLYLQSLEQQLLQRRRENPNEPMPIYIDLKRFNTQTVKQCFSLVLREKYHLTYQQLQKEKIILLMDGYDEIAGSCHTNLYTSQNLDQWPKLKMIIGCRSQYLTSGYIDWFIPSTGGMKEIELLPFSDLQINQYIEKYVGAGGREYGVDEYQKHIKNIPNLGQLITNPLILRILVESLPELTKHIEQGKEVNRYSIYEAFMRSWFIKQEKRLAENTGLPNGWDVVKAFQDFSKRFALNLHINNQVEAQIEESSPEAIKARNGCPLQQGRDHNYSFIHKSFLEYFSALALLEGVLNSNNIIQPAHIIQELSVIDFFQDMIELEPQLRKDLLNQVMISRTNKKLGETAANAITLLNAMQQSFTGMNLSQISIPGAILDGGIFDGTDFTEADLQKVSFKSAWLNNSCFKKAAMNGVTFGERPYLRLPCEVESCCYSSDGKWLVVAAGEDIILYDNENLRQIKTFKGHSRDVTCVSFSPDGQIIASGSEDKTLRLWEVSTGKEKQCLQGHSDSVTSVCFSPNGQIISSGSWDNTIRLWEINTGKAKQCFEGHSSRVTSVSFSPNGQIIVSGSQDETIRLWEANTGEEKQCLKGHSDCVNSVCFSPNGQIIASGSQDETIRLWDVNTGEEKQCLKGHSDRVTSVCFSPNGKIIASGSSDDTIRLWEVITGKEKQCLQGHSSKVTSISFSPNRQIIASGSWDNTIRLWEVDTGKAKQYLKGHSGCVNSVSFSPNGQIVASGSYDNTIRLWGINTGKEKQCLKGHSESVTSVSFNHNGLIIASGSDDKTVRLWEVSTGKEKQCLQGHSDSVTSVCFSPNGQIIASGSLDSTIRLWEVETGKEKQCLTEHSNRVTSVCFSPNGQIVASGSWDNTIRLWEVNTGKEKQCFKGHSDCVNSVSFSPNGQIIVSGNQDETIRLWDVNTGEEKQCLKGHSESVTSVSFSPNRHLIASGSWDNTICLWEVNSKKEKKCLQWHPSRVTSISFSPNGRIIASGSWDNTLRLWEVSYRYCFRLLWSSGLSHFLATKDTNFKDAQGLSNEQFKLLKQRQGQNF